MPRSPAHEKFLASTHIGHEEWHDGTGYDLDVFAAMTPAEPDEVALAAREKSDLDWREMEVLGAHGSPESFERLRYLLAERAQGIPARASALRVLIDRGQTPGSVADVQLAHLIDELDDENDLLPALDLASWHGGPMTKLALLRGAQNRPKVSLHFAARLLDLAKLSDDMSSFDPKFRPTLLRLLPDNEEQDRAAAFAEICALLKIDANSIPEPGSGFDRAWAEKTWPKEF